MANPRTQRLKGRAGWSVLLLVTVGLLWVGVSADSGPRSSEERIEEISKRLACPICDGESVFESRNNASRALKNEIREQVLAGQRSDEQIITFITERYGEQVALVPRAEGFDALVWVLPVFVFVCAVAGLAVAFRRWRQTPDIGPTDDDRALVAAALAARPAGDDDGAAGTVVGVDPDARGDRELVDDEEGDGR
jgi:cytochrome c-type biogenesis protein CcmH